MRPSMGSVRDAYDNAMCESFFSSLEAELLNQRRFRSEAEARMAAFSYIEAFYNPVRRHSALGYRSSIQSEKDHARTTQITPSDQDPDPSTRLGQSHLGYSSCNLAITRVY